MADKVVNKKTFEVAVDGAVTTFAVVLPNHMVAQQADIVYKRAFRAAASPADGKPGALVRQKVEAILREQNLWDDAKQARYEELVRGVLAGEKTLAAGGIKLSEARDVALKMRRDRAELRWLLAARNELDAMTAEAQAEQARFNYLVAACTVYGDSGKPYYKDVDDFLSRTDDPVALPASQQFGKLLYGVQDDYEQKLPESKFLLKYKFVDEKLRLVDKAGNLVDEKGRRVDDQGRLINEAGELVDADGNLLTEDGEYKVEFREFVDDLGAEQEAQPAETAA